MHIYSISALLRLLVKIVMYSNVYWHNTYTKQVNIPVVVKQKHAAHKTIAESMKT